mmetsp:Transcript_4473/g.8894  ORF Transcript_4473/g.8894 Transcript_4473/m.8894 type:complete len:212 (+) Transcript_4473:309-944(+)
MKFAGMAFVAGSVGLRRVGAGCAIGSGKGRTWRHGGGVAAARMMALAEPRSTAVPASNSVELSQRPGVNWEVKLLYDGDCPLCMREVNFLMKQDAGRGKVAFVDISSLDYSPEDNGGITFEDAMGRIHAVLPGGTTLVGVPVFRKVYDTLGMGWVYAATRWPVVGPAVTALYELWAGLRLRVTGRPDLATIIEERQRLLAQRECETSCKLY